MLADLKIGGETRRVVMQAPKNGFFYVLDAGHRKADLGPRNMRRSIGRRRSTSPLAARSRRRSRAIRTAPAAIRSPVRSGRPQLAADGLQPQGAAGLHPGDGQRRQLRRPGDLPGYIPGAWNTGERRPAVGPSAPRAPPPAGPASFGELVAWDPVAQKPRWTVRFPQAWTSGVLATDSGLVFHTAGSTFAAYDAGSGRRVWAYELGAGAVAPASTYEIDGQQYLALMVGYGGAVMGGDQPRRKGRLLVFKLGGNVKPPAYPAPAAAAPLDLAGAAPSRGDADKGACASSPTAGPATRPAGSICPTWPARRRSCRRRASRPSSSTGP